VRTGCWVVDARPVGDQVCLVLEGEHREEVTYDHVIAAQVSSWTSTAWLHLVRSSSFPEARRRRAGPVAFIRVFGRRLVLCRSPAAPSLDRQCGSYPVTVHAGD